MMIKTTEEIFNMCEEWYKNLSIKKQNNQVILDDPRPLFYKKWVDRDKLVYFIKMELGHTPENEKYKDSHFLGKTILKVLGVDE